jgi:tRNA dimethylallyltransferase
MPDIPKAQFDALLQDLPPERPVLIAGPTASGKSALALAIAEAQGGVIVNADASQVYAPLRIISARPSAEEEARAPHLLYGHLAEDAPYSTGHWLREVAPLLGGDQRVIITGGTGLYFSALTQGLAKIPETPPEVRAQGDDTALEVLLAQLDPETAAGIDSKTAHGCSVLGRFGPPPGAASRTGSATPARRFCRSRTVCRLSSTWSGNGSTPVSRSALI